MAVQTAASAFAYTGNNSTSTVYPFPAPFLLPSDIYVHVKVTADEEDEGQILQQGVDYTLTPLLNGDNLITSGEITTAIAYDDSYTLTIFRQVPLTQLTEFPETGPFPSRAVEQLNDKVFMALQQIQRRVAVLEGNEDDVGVIVVPGGGGPDALQDVATFADSAARASAIPKRVGQLGFQVDNNSLWRSFATIAGSWAAYPLDEDDFVSDSAIHPPSQQSTKAYINSLAPKLWDTGDLKATSRASLPTGWVWASGRTIGNAGSGATERANDDCEDLFTLYWTDYSDALIPIQTSAGGASTRGASAAADWAANKRITIPDLRGRAIVGRDDMGGTAASRMTNTGTGNPGINGSTLGSAGGVDRHTLTTAQMPSHTHTYTFLPGAGASVASGGGYVAATQNTGPAGGDQAHSNVQPSFIGNIIIKL